MNIDMINEILIKYHIDYKNIKSYNEDTWMNNLELLFINFILTKKIHKLPANYIDVFIDIMI
jgi:hypothetical protein